MWTKSQYPTMYKNTNHSLEISLKQLDCENGQIREGKVVKKVNTLSRAQVKVKKNNNTIEQNVLLQCF